MTDNEIIKALECCIGRNGWGDPKCYECPFDGSNPNIGCKKSLLNNALDLINRQNTEIERLRKIVHKRAEMEFGKIVEVVDRARADIRAEAIKEFAERIKKHCTNFILNEYIDSLVEEMTEEQK